MKFEFPRKKKWINKKSTLIRKKIEMGLEYVRQISRDGEKLTILLSMIEIFCQGIEKKKDNYE